MKQLIFVFFFLNSLNILASKNTLIFEKVTNKYLDYKVNFKINQNLGRAWIVITEINDFYDEETQETEYRVKVEGLSFNKPINEITFTDVNKIKSTCAFYTTKRGLFGYSRITTTNNCLIEQRIVTKEYDDGFNITRKSVVQFFLNM